MPSTSSPISTSSNFEALFNAALAKYTEQNERDLRNHPLASQIDSCDSPDAILNMFEKQAEAFDEFRKGDTKLFKWFKPIIGVLHAISTNEHFTNIASNVCPATL